MIIQTPLLNQLHLTGVDRQKLEACHKVPVTLRDSTEVLAACTRTTAPDADAVTTQVARHSILLPQVVASEACSKPSTAPRH